jgi:hypothetical protein
VVAGHSQGINPYAYVWNEPLRLTDPSGFCPEAGVDCGPATIGGGRIWSPWPADVYFTGVFRSWPWYTPSASPPSAPYESPAMQVPREGRATFKPLADKSGSVDIEPEIIYGPNAQRSAVSSYTEKVLQDIMRRAGVRRIVISSTARDAANQARVMKENIEKDGVRSQRGLYKEAGQKVIDVYEREKTAGRSNAEIEGAMRQEIERQGPGNVSRHSGDPAVRNVVDIDPRSLGGRVEDFIDAAKSDSRVDGRRILRPPKDPGIHLEIPQPQERKP